MIKAKQGAIEINMKQNLIKLSQFLLRPEQFIAVFTLIAGSYFVLSVPLGFGPDEATHAFRSYGFTQGDLFPKVIPVQKAHQHDPGKRVGNEISSGIANFTTYSADRVLWLSQGNPYPIDGLAVQRNVPIESGPRVFVHFENTALYSPANYIPQIAGFLVARTLDISVVYTLYIVRFLVLLFWVAVLSLSLRLIPTGWRWPVGLTLMVPTAITQAATLSADSVCLGASLLFVVYSIRLARDRYVISVKQLAVLGLLGLWLCLLKPPYPLIAVLPIAFMLIRRSPQWATAAKMLAVLSPGLLLGLWWNAAIAPFSVPYRNVVLLDSVVPDSPKQAAYLIHHFWQAPQIVGVSLGVNAQDVFANMFGLISQHLIAPGYVFAWLGAMVALLLVYKATPLPGRAMRGVLLGGAVVIVFVASLLIYISWTAIGASRIEGLQGRYFLPVLPMIAIGALGLTKRFQSVWGGRIMIVAIVILVTVALGTAAVSSTQYYEGLNALILPKAVLGYLIPH